MVANKGTAGWAFEDAAAVKFEEHWIPDAAILEDRDELTWKVYQLLSLVTREEFPDKQLLVDICAGIGVAPAEELAALPYNGLWAALPLSYHEIIETYDDLSLTPYGVVYFQHSDHEDEIIRHQNGPKDPREELILALTRISLYNQEVNFRHLPEKERYAALDG